MQFHEHNAAIGNGKKEEIPTEVVNKPNTIGTNASSISSYVSHSHSNGLTFLLLVVILLKFLQQLLVVVHQMFHMAV